MPGEPVWGSSLVSSTVSLLSDMVSLTGLERAYLIESQTGERLPAWHDMDRGCIRQALQQTT